MRGHRDERGSIAPLAVALCLVLCVAVGFLADVAVLYGAKARQEQALDAARAACMQVCETASAKYADDPGAVVADCVVDQVRAQGVQGPVRVWFYEAPVQAVAKSERLWVIGMQVEDSQGIPLPAGAASGGVNVASSRVFCARPYAAVQVWRPDARVCGVHAFDADCGAGQGSFSAIGSLDGFPEQMARQARALLNG